MNRTASDRIARDRRRGIWRAGATPAGFAAAICLLTAASPAARRPQSNAQSAGNSIKTTSAAVNTYAIVEGRRGRLIRDLDQDDFQVLENSIPQKIQHFSRETDATLNLGVAIDTSLSQERLLGTEQEAAKKFLRSVLQGGDQAFVMNFDVDVQLLKDFTNAPAELVKAVDSARINVTGKSALPENAGATGGTHLYDAVYLASNELMKTRTGRKVLVLVTDGEDEGSKIDLRASIESAEKADVIVYSIVVSDAQYYALMGGSYHGDASVRKLSRQTGGRTIVVKSVDEVGGAFDQIAGELRAQYLLGYFPADLRGDGSFRRIQVRVRGHNYTVRTRAGYYDQGPAQAAVTEPR